MNNEKFPSLDSIELINRFVGRRISGRLTRFTGLMTAATISEIAYQANGNEKLLLRGWCLCGLAAFQQGLIAIEQSSEEGINIDDKL